MRLSRKTAPLCGIAVAASLALGACTSTRGDNKSQRSKQASARTNQIAATPYDEVQDGGNLRWPVTFPLANFNIFAVDSGGEPTAVLPTLPPVWHFKADGTPFLDRDVVDSASSSTSTPQVVKYHINSKATWSDGTPITYKDFQGMFNALNGKVTTYKAAVTSGYDQIQSVEKGATDQDVTVTFAKPYSEWQSLFSPLIPASLTATPAAFTKSWVNGPNVSGGPFMVDKIDKTAKTITVKRNDKWWGRKPKLDSITFVTLDANAQAKAFQSDQVDFFEIGADPAAYKQARGVSGAEVRKAGGPNFQHIDLGQRGALANASVRQAVMLSLDRVDDAKAMLSALDWPAVTMDSHIWMNNQTQYKATCGAYCKTDVARADSLLEGAGYNKRSDGYYAKDGKVLSLNFVIPSDATTWATEATIQQSALKKAGIKVVIKTVASDPFFPNYVIPGNFDLTVFSWLGAQFPLSSAKQIYASKGESNFSKIGTAELDRLLDEANTTLDATKQVELSYQIDQRIWREGHSAVLYQLPDLVACKKGLVNFGAFGFADRDYTLIGYKPR